MSGPVGETPDAGRDRVGRLRIGRDGPLLRVAAARTAAQRRPVVPGHDSRRDERHRATPQRGVAELAQMTGNQTGRPLGTLRRHHEGRVGTDNPKHQRESEGRLPDNIPLILRAEASHELNLGPSAPSSCDRFVALRVGNSISRPLAAAAECRYTAPMPKMKAEYWLILALVFISGLAFPAFLDVNRIQTILVTICAGVGLN